jgi:uncharacterized protein (DUF2252 family)
MTTTADHAPPKPAAGPAEQVPEKLAHPPVTERAARGRGVRGGCPRQSHAAADVEPRDPVALLEAQARTRVEELVPIRYGRMLTSPFAFYRGAASIMAHDLSPFPRTGLQVQLCGDAHLANFGGFASPERDFVFDLNDFDETLPGPFEWDVKRLAASVEVAGRHRDFTEAERTAAVLAVVRSYRTAMREFAAMGNLAVWYSRLSATDIEAKLTAGHDTKQLKTLVRAAEKARTRDHVRAFHKLTHTVDGNPRIVSDPPLIVPVEDILSGFDDPESLLGIVRSFLRGYRRTLPNDRRRLLEQFSYADVARKVVGVGSVGTRCWVVLMIGRDTEDPLFLQIKESEESVLERYLGRSKFQNRGQRVVEGQRLMQASSDIFLGWYRTIGLDGHQRDFYGRQLWDWKASVDVEAIVPRGLELYAEACGWTLARAHARSGDRIAIAEYLGKGDAFERALQQFAAAYADQNERDYEALRAAAESGRIKVEEGL